MGTSFIFSAFLSSSFKNPAVMSVLFEIAQGHVSESTVCEPTKPSLHSLDVSGTNAVDVDTHIGPLHGETLGEQVDGALRGTVT